MAAQRAIATNDSDPLITDPFAERLIEALGAGYFIRLARGELSDSDTEAENARAMVDSIALRTRYFDDALIDAVNAGIRQAVILASGLDTRAYRLPWTAATTVFELDQPAVIDFKTRTLARLGAYPPVRHRPLAVDLRTEWPAALIGADFNPAEPTVWIAEGLVIYLPPAAQDRLFDDIAELSAPGSRIAAEDITGITADQLARISERLRALWTDAAETEAADRQMPIDVADLWYVGERVPASDYLAAKGWTVTTVRTTELFGRYGRPLPVGPVTPFGDPTYVTAISG